MLVELHAHTLASDGLLSGLQTVEHLFYELDISGVGITDHDTTDALLESQEVAKKLGVHFIPGFECSTYCRELGITPHILGYFSNAEVAINDAWFQKVFYRIIINSFQRIKKICEASQADPLIIDGHKISVTIEEVQSKAQREYPGIAGIFFEVVQHKILELTGYNFSGHDIAYILMGREKFYNKHQQFFKSHQVKFSEKRWYRPKSLDSLPETLEVFRHIKQIGGIPVLAHPNDVGKVKQLQEFAFSEEHLRLFVEHGLEGVECYLPQWSLEQVDSFIKMANKYHLLVTGGTDFHGPNYDYNRRPGYYNSNSHPIPESCFWDLWEALCRTA